MLVVVGSEGSDLMYCVLVVVEKVDSKEPFRFCRVGLPLEDFQRGAREWTVRVEQPIFS